jgi:hypothetical protein
VDGDSWAEAAWEAYDERERYEGYARDMTETLYPHRGAALEVTVEALETWLEIELPRL